MQDNAKVDELLVESVRTDSLMSTIELLTMTQSRDIIEHETGLPLLDVARYSPHIDFSLVCPHLHCLFVHRAAERMLQVELLLRNGFKDKA